MKVAYNKCFGGFGLSSLAITEFAKRKGINLTWYEQVGYKHEGNELYKKCNEIPNGNGISCYALTKDLGDEIKSLPNDVFYYPDFSGDNRRDPDLINIIEELGKKANGMCADLAIEEIPDGADFEITEYDGNERVLPPRPSW